MTVLVCVYTIGPSAEDFKVVKVHQLNKKPSQDNLKYPRVDIKDDFNKPRILKIHSDDPFNPNRRTEINGDELLKRVIEHGNAAIDTLRHRLQLHRDIARHWDPQNAIVSLHRAINTGEQAVLIDLLSIYNHKMSLWTLNTCLVVLPELRYLIQCQKLYFVQTTANTLKLILKTFGPVIAMNVSQPPATGAGVDISREERHQKCQDSFAHLNSIREYIFSHKGDNISTEISRILEELKRAFSALD